MLRAVAAEFRDLLGFRRFCSKHRPPVLKNAVFSAGIGAFCRANGYCICVCVYTHPRTHIVLSSARLHRCGKHATFGAGGSSALYCRLHKHPSHVNVKCWRVEEEFLRVVAEHAQGLVR